MKPSSPHTATAVLAGGCFWCLEASYQMVRGVTAVTSGYAGGHDPQPTYERVSAGVTGHAEAVRIDYDPATVSYEQLLEIFWLIHDPTTPDRQGHDIGPQYRSVIFYTDDDQRDRAQASIDAAQKLLSDPIVTQLVPLDKFYEAEDYHQNYFQSHPDQAYCRAVINPKLTKLRSKYAQLLKETA